MEQQPMNNVFVTSETVLLLLQRPSIYMIFYHFIPYSHLLLIGIYA